MIMKIFLLSLLLLNICNDVIPEITFTEYLPLLNQNIKHIQLKMRNLSMIEVTKNDLNKIFKGLNYGKAISDFRKDPIDRISFYFEWMIIGRENRVFRNNNFPRIIFEFNNDLLKGIYLFLPSDRYYNKIILKLKENNSWVEGELDFSHNFVSDFSMKRKISNVCRLWENQDIKVIVDLWTVGEKEGMMLVRILSEYK